MKVKNPETNTEETEKISVDEEGQTETVDSKDQTFIKDFTNVSILPIYVYCNF